MNGGGLCPHLSGMSSLATARGIQVMRIPGRDHEPAWLNAAFAIGEGSSDAAIGVPVVRYCAGTVDYLPASRHLPPSSCAPGPASAGDWADLSPIDRVHPDGPVWMWREKPGKPFPTAANRATLGAAPRGRHK